MKFFDDFGVFLWGKFDYERSELAAQNCDKFRLDSDDDELVSTKEKSCYNCLLRRFTKESFECLKLK